MKNKELKPYSRLKNLFRELTLYRAFVQLAKLKGINATIPGQGALSVDELLDSARKSPKLEAYVNSHFHEFEKSLALPNETLFDRALRELLEESDLYDQTRDKPKDTLN
jgi:hypothetical protein